MEQSIDKVKDNILGREITKVEKIILFILIGLSLTGIAIDIIVPTIIGYFTIVLLLPIYILVLIRKPLSNVLTIVLFVLIGLFIAGATIDIFVPNIQGFSGILVLIFLYLLVLVIRPTFKKATNTLEIKHSKYYWIMFGLLVIEIGIALLFYFFATSAKWVYAAFSTGFFITLFIYIYQSSYLDQIKIKPKKEITSKNRGIVFRTTLIIAAVFIVVVFIKAIILLIRYA